MGFTQTYGVDYQETFAPVAKMNSIRVLLSLASNLDWPLHQFDVKNAFLHGDFEEEVYMDIPLGFEDVKTKGKVCLYANYFMDLNSLLGLGLRDLLGPCCDMVSNRVKLIILCL
ncbi:hypothetical protein CsSME_00010313 [Camellia sinensis var. sinensis]